jgi:hypothetical protein
MAAKIATPCRMSRTMRPNMKQKAAGISRIATISMKLVSGVGFS